MQKKIDALEETYFIGKEMPEETHRKFMDKYGAEKAEIYQTMELCGNDSSNLSGYYISALQFSMKLPLVWASSPVAVKEKIPKMIFLTEWHIITKMDHFEPKR